MTPEKLWLCLSGIIWFCLIVSSFDVSKYTLGTCISAYFIAWGFTGWIPYLIIKFL